MPKCRGGCKKYDRKTHHCEKKKKYGRKRELEVIIEGCGKPSDYMRPERKLDCPIGQTYKQISGYTGPLPGNTGIPSFPVNTITFPIPELGVSEWFSLSDQNSTTPDVNVFVESASTNNLNWSISGFYSSNHFLVLPSGNYDISFSLTAMMDVANTLIMVSVGEQYMPGSHCAGSPYMVSPHMGSPHTDSHYKIGGKPFLVAPNAYMVSAFGITNGSEWINLAANGTIGLNCTTDVGLVAFVNRRGTNGLTVSSINMVVRKIC
jgi:hypothetical protein